MKKFVLTLSVFLLLAGANIANASNADLRVLPADVSAIIALSDYEKLFNSMFTFMISSLESGDSTDEASAFIEEFSGYIDDSQMFYAGFMGTDININMPESELQSRLFFMIPMTTDEDSIVDLLKEFDAPLETFGNDTYELDGLYFVFVEGEESTYGYFSFSQRGIDRYFQSDILADSSDDNAEAIAEHLEDMEDNAGSIYITGDIYNNALELIEQSSGGSGLISDSLRNLFEEYNLISDLDHISGYTTAYTTPIEGELNFFGADGDVDNRIFSDKRAEGAVYIDGTPDLYFEINIEPQFIIDVLNASGVARQSGLTPEQMQELQKTISGSFAVASYDMEQAISQYFRKPPNLIGFIGVDNGEWAELMIKMMAPYDTINIQAQEVLKLQGNEQVPYVYILFTSTDIVFSTQYDTMEDYIDNWLDGSDDFASEIGTYNGEQQILTLVMPDAQFLQTLSGLFMGGMPMDAGQLVAFPESVYFDIDITSDESAVNYYLQSE